MLPILSSLNFHINFSLGLSIPLKSIMTSYQGGIAPYINLQQVIILVVLIIPINKYDIFFNIYLVFIIVPVNSFKPFFLVKLFTP